MTKIILTILLRGGGLSLVAAPVSADDDSDPKAQHAKNVKDSGGGCPTGYETFIPVGSDNSYHGNENGDTVTCTSGSGDSWRTSTKAEADAEGTPPTADENACFPDEDEAMAYAKNTPNTGDTVYGRDAYGNHCVQGLPPPSDMQQAPADDEALLTDPVKSDCQEIGAKFVKYVDNDIWDPHGDIDTNSRLRLAGPNAACLVAA